MGARITFLVLAVAGVLIAARFVCGRPCGPERTPTAAPSPQTRAAAAPSSLPAPAAAGPVEMARVVRTVGEAPQEVSLSEGARAVFETALAAQDLGGSVDLAASLATDPEMKRALLDEVGRRLPGAQGEERCRLLAILATLGDPQGFALWKAALESDYDAHRRELLARHPVTTEPFAADAIDAVLRLARDDREASVRQAAIEGLPSGLSRDRMQVFLGAIAGDPEPSVRRAALAYLSEDARGDGRLATECARLVADETQDREVRLLASAILRDARQLDPSAAPDDPDAKPNGTELDRSLPNR